MRRTDIRYVEVYLSMQVILLHLKKKVKEIKANQKNLHKPKRAAAIITTKKMLYLVIILFLVLLYPPT